MDSYSASGQITACTPAPGDTALGVIASALTRGKIHYFMVSAGGVAADNVLAWLVRRFTATGSYTPVTPTPLDGGGPAAQMLAGEQFTVEPTFTLTLFELSVHQRSLFQWNATPGREIVIPATSGAGVGVTPTHGSYVGQAEAVVHWQE